MEETKNKSNCQFDLAWIGKCKKPTIEGLTMCEEHSKIKCCSCGEPATHQCAETMGLVCGADLCDKCEHTICENGCNSGATLPPGLKGHCRKDQQVYTPWYMRERKEKKEDDEELDIEITFYAPKGFFKAQVETKEGLYTLRSVKLDKIDVVSKGIANREFFKWDDNIDAYIEDIKNNFAQTPPVILEEFEGKLYSIDGHHRIVAAIELGKTNILAFVIRVNKLTYPRKDDNTRNN